MANIKKSWKPNTQTRTNVAGNKRGVRRGKNLQKSPDGFLYNQYGIEFSFDEKKRLESLVNTANAKRRRMLKQEGEMELFTGGEAQGTGVADNVLGRESDFVIQAKTKSLQRFRTREDFDNYLKNLERTNKRDYIDTRVQQYKDNYIQALEGQGIDKNITKSLKKMKTKDFMKLARTEEYARFGYVYDQGMKTKVEAGIKAGIQRVTGVNIDNNSGDIDLT